MADASTNIGATEIMADKYRDFADLERHEQAGITYDIAVRRAQPRFAIIAPHGGSIEAGTSEIADAVAGLIHSFYTFEGLKPTGNHELHITSTRFDEPMCLTLIGVSDVVVTIHGEHSEAEGEGVFMGGLDTALGAGIGDKLSRAGFDARPHADPNLQGREPTNLCNRGRSNAGVQLELSKAVRRTMFASLLPDGRKHTTARFDAFVNAVREALDHSVNPDRASSARSA
jgi:phage replication-related protein YjqB (UPF0714/DUF867 family)